ncbi:MAG: flavin reductase [Clostridiales bacterium]|nr:flavin reductase [Clostridiales bacterium]
MNTKALYKLTYGLFVLSANQDGRDNACIVNTIVQVTSSPVRITVAVNKENLTHDMIAATGVFNATILSKNAPFDVFRHFGMQSGKSADKMSGIDYRRTENGLAIFPKHATAYICAKVISATDIGTHTLFLADVTDCDDLSDDEPVTYAYYQSSIKVSAPKPNVKGWRCTVCGYIYEGDELPPDYICPICKHGAEVFERIV